MRPEWGQERPTRRRRLLLIGGVAAATLSLAIVVGLFVIYPRVGESAIRDRAIPKLAARLGHTVSVESVDVGLGRAVLEGLKVVDRDGVVLADVPKVVLRFGFGASLLGRVDLESVAVYRASILTIISATGETSWDGLRPSQGAGGGGKRGIVPERAELIAANYELRDLGRDLTAVGEGLDATFEGGRVEALTQRLTVMTGLGPRAELSSVGVRGTARSLGETAEIEIGGGTLTLWPGMRLTGVSGTVGPASSGDSLWIDLGGGWGGSDGRVWQAVGAFNPETRKGNLKLSAERFELRRLASVLGDTPLRGIDKTFLGAELDIVSDGDRVTATGSVDVEKLSFFLPKLAADTIADLSFTGEVAAHYEISERLLSLERADVRAGGVEYKLEGFVRRGHERLLDELHARIRVPSVSCQAVLESIPVALVPKLSGFVLRGKFSTDVEVHIQWDDLEATTLDGSVAIRNCEVTKASPGMSAEKIKGSFKHRIIVGFDGDEPVYREMTVGPENSSYISVDFLSPHLVNSLLTTEDSSFYKHRGFIVSEFRTALIKNLEAGYFRYGASSITMQIAKNVYLDRDKTLSRKLQELFMTWYLETKVPKRRLLEVYVNAIEYGPALYGIGAAAQRYFGKSAAFLNPTEAAFFSSILPAPRRRFKQYCSGELTGWTARKIERILGLMLKRERITQEEYDRAIATPLVFRADKSGCRGR